MPENILQLNSTAIKPCASERVLFFALKEFPRPRPRENRTPPKNYPITFFNHATLSDGCVTLLYGSGPGSGPGSGESLPENYSVAPSLISRIGDFLCFAGTIFCDWKRLVFLAGN